MGEESRLHSPVGRHQHQVHLLQQQQEEQQHDSDDSPSTSGTNSSSLLGQQSTGGGGGGSGGGNGPLKRKQRRYRYNGVAFASLFFFNVFLISHHALFIELMIKALILLNLNLPLHNAGRLSPISNWKSWNTHSTRPTTPMSSSERNWPLKSISPKLAFRLQQFFILILNSFKG